MARATYIFAGGGTGGHLYPGLAVAEALCRRRDDALVVFACSDRPIDRAILEPTGYPFIAQPVQPLRKSISGLAGFGPAWLASLRLTRRLLRDLAPRAVLGLGGFAAGPVLRLAGGRLPAALLNPDAVPGRANRYLARRVDTIFTQFESTGSHFSAAPTIRCVGCPVRAELMRGERADAMRHFDLDPARQTLLVFGGSTLARSLGEALIELADDFQDHADRWQGLFVVSRDQLDAVEQAYAGRAFRAVCLSYCNAMGLAYAAADVALVRGGAGTIAELTATATPAVIVPYPHHADRQQYLNAREMVAAGAGEIVDDRLSPQANGESLRRTLLAVMARPQRLETMQQAADGQARRSAAEEVAAWLDGW